MKKTVRMKKTVLFLLLVTALGGCAMYAPSLPEDYSGPVATVEDSVKVHSGSKADFFYLAKIDGNKIQNSRLKTLQDNYGRGFRMDPVTLGHEIPAAHCTVTIVGRTEYAAPILALTNSVYEVSGDITFTPNPDKAYLVKGVLGEEYSAVWIEEKLSKEVVGKVEVNGSAALGILEK